MIPISLTLSGFLSYQEPVEVDFTSFELACIAGSNGAGKSSLLDAITWALFGRARKHDESIINNQSRSAEVTFVFEYEGNIYRVIRTNPRGDTKLVEFHIQSSESGSEPIWKPLTERTLRETDSRIEEILRLDYETFTNAAFFLQGEADLFTQQSPSARKRILSKILGLEIWETYRKRAFQQRKVVESNIDTLDGRLSEINAELAEEEERKAHLRQLQSDLDSAREERKAQEESLDTIRALQSAVEEQRKQVQSLTRQIEQKDLNIQKLISRLTEREEEKAAQNAFLEQEEEIKAHFLEWEKARAELEEWEATAEQFRGQEKLRQQPLTRIAAEKARLEEELRTLKEQQAGLDQERGALPELEEKHVEMKAGIAEAQEKLSRRDELQQDLEKSRGRLAEARAENPRLKNEMDELKERIVQLSASDGSTCPLCGQPLSPDERQKLIEKLNREGTSLGDRYRANQKVLTESDRVVKELQLEITRLSAAEDSLRKRTREADQIHQRREEIFRKMKEWQEKSAIRMEEIQKALDEESFAPDARKHLAEINQKLKEIGYDAARHDQVQKTVAQGEDIQTRIVELEKARAALQPLEREVQDLKEQTQELQTERTELQLALRESRAALDELEEKVPDLDEAEQAYLLLQERENKLQREVGAALQKVQVLETQKTRKRELLEQRDKWAEKIARCKQLELAFGKNGVPALLIEQSLPEIETRANEILDRLSNGEMSVKFQTQREYRDKSREDLKETLDIQIRDRAGERDYEMYSGGEAFRVNFAIRLALSYVLARRAGARLQTLVIDEGFGSQDAIGRQRLVEAINIIRGDFKKILVITHIDELKDAFSTQLLVEKTPAGSQVTLMA